MVQPYCNTFSVYFQDRKGGFSFFLAGHKKELPPEILRKTQKKKEKFKFLQKKA